MGGIIDLNILAGRTLHPRRIPVKSVPLAFLREPGEPISYETRKSPAGRCRIALKKRSFERFSTLHSNAIYKVNIDMRYLRVVRFSMNRPQTPSATRTPLSHLHVLLPLFALFGAISHFGPLCFQQLAHSFALMGEGGTGHSSRQSGDGTRFWRGTNRFVAARSRQPSSNI